MSTSPIRDSNQPKPAASSDTIADLQMRLAYQDDDIRQLNTAVVRQQEAIDTLQREVGRLRELIEGLASPPAEPSGDEPPPHY